MCPIINSKGGTFHENGILQLVINDKEDIIVSIGVNDRKVIYNSVSERDTIQVLDVHD